MKSTYISLLSMVIGWNILSYWTGIHWIGYIALGIAFIGIISEKFAEKFVAGIHTIFKKIFYFIQTISLTMIYYLLITPISILKKSSKNKEQIQIWKTINSDKKNSLEKMW